MKVPAFPIAGLLSLALVSCLPEERVWWSPDGTTAVVRAPDALHLADADGRLGPAMEMGGTPESDLPDAVDWLPDGGGLVFARRRPLENWEEAKSRIPEVEAAAVEDLAAVLPAMVRAALDHGPGRTIGNAVANLPVRPSPWTEPAARLAYLRDPKGIRDLLQSRSDGKDLLDALAKDAGALTLHELCRWKFEAGKPVGQPVVLAASVRPFGGIQVSPDGRHILFLQTGAEENSRDLAVMPAAGGPGSTLAESARWLACDWAPDSRAVMMATPDGGGGPLSRIERRDLPSGREGKEAAAPVVLARAILFDPPAIAVLPDGRVLFAARAGSLPGAGAEPAIRGDGLFLAAADGSAVVPVPVATGSMPSDLRFLTVSPDGKRVAMVESGGTAVTVIHLADGSWQKIQESTPNWDCRVLPSWRNDHEFTIGGLRDGKPVAMRWSLADGPGEWSRGWPSDITGEWLKERTTGKGQATP